jgi:ABC-type Fe3+ transport system permease subunit
MQHLGIIAVAVYILVTLFLLALPKHAINKRVKQEYDIGEKSWRSSNAKLNYYKMIAGIGALITIVIMLVVKYVIL